MIEIILKNYHQSTVEDKSPFFGNGLLLIVSQP